MISSNSPFQSLGRSSKSLQKKLKSLGIKAIGYHPNQLKPIQEEELGAQVTPEVQPSELKPKPSEPNSSDEIIAKWRVRAEEARPKAPKEYNFFKPEEETYVTNPSEEIRTPVVPNKIAKPISKPVTDKPKIRSPEATRPNDTSIGEPLLENEKFEVKPYITPPYLDKNTGKMKQYKKSNGKLQIPTALGMINISSITSQKRGLRLTETIMLNPQGDKWGVLPNTDPWDRTDIVALLNRAKIDRARAKELVSSKDEFTPGEIRKAVEEGTMSKSDGDRTLKELEQRKIAKEIMVKLRESEVKQPRIVGRYSYTPESLVVRLTEIYGGDKGKAEEMVDKLIGAAS